MMNTMFGRVSAAGKVEASTAEAQTGTRHDKSFMTRFCSKAVCGQWRSFWPGKERLEAIPWTRFSLAAEKQFEREGARPHARLGARTHVARGGEPGETGEAFGEMPE